MSTAAAAQILQTLGPSCRDSGRRDLLLAQNNLNGIDFVEFETVLGVAVLHVHFLNAWPLVDLDPYGLVTNPSRLHVHGGSRILGVAVKKVIVAGPKILNVLVDQQGDFSPYLLSLGWSLADDGVWNFDIPGIDIDRLFSVAPINFRPGCPVDVDCAPVDDCPPDTLGEPMLDYMARDYASFRQMLLDLVAQRQPNWVERSPADIGIALLELFAYEGDHISYFQDAVANEAFLDTARQRVSAKRHAKLVDYQMHDGRNAWTYVHVGVSAAGDVPVGTQLVTRIDTAMRFDRDGSVPVPQPTAPPGTILHEITDLDFKSDPALRQVRVFETAVKTHVDPLNNEIRIHSWGNEQCCFPRGRTSAHLYTITAGTAVRPPLNVGDYLLFEEVASPTTGAAADADPTHRQVVQITRINDNALMRDPLFLAAIDPAKQEPTQAPGPGPTPPPLQLPLLEVAWRAVDALTFPLCVTAQKADKKKVPCVSLARGNMVLADHGRTIASKPTPSALANDGEIYSFTPPLDATSTFRLRLGEGPLTMQCEPAGQPAAFPPLRDRPDLTYDVRAARPAIALRATKGAMPKEMYYPVADLLSSSEFDRHFVADVDDRGRAVLRFGDGEYGQSPQLIDEFEVWYRIGNGRNGNVGAEALAHVVTPAPLPANWPTVTRIRNPLPARDGTDPETIEEVRQYAPAAFRAVQLRAVTEQDYVDVALKLDGVAGAVANFRWTGSWYTVFVGIDPSDPANLLTNGRGITTLDPAFKQSILDALTQYRLAGYDLEIRSARYVPLDLAIHVCAKAGFFSGDVAGAVASALGSGTHRGLQGLFNPARLNFGQTIYLSRIYEAVKAVEGVEAATVTAFHRHGRDPAGEIESGRLPIGPWEIARLDNDRSNLENGTLTIDCGGGS